MGTEGSKISDLKHKRKINRRLLVSNTRYLNSKRCNTPKPTSVQKDLHLNSGRLWKERNTSAVPVIHTNYVCVIVFLCIWKKRRKAPKIVKTSSIYGDKICWSGCAGPSQYISPIHFPKGSLEWGNTQFHDSLTQREPDVWTELTYLLHSCFAVSL